MSAMSPGAMRATLGLDTGQFETRARAAAKAAEGMAGDMARAFEAARQASALQGRSFEELRASIDPAFAASQRYAALQREVAGMVESGAASQRAANLVLEQAAAKYMGLETAAQVAARTQRESAAAVESAARSYHALRASLDPVYAATKRYEAAQEQLALAVRAGVVSQAEANRVLALAERPLAATLAAQTAATAGASRMGPAFVNAGFQVQDFAVQVAGGQSALLAFAQQLPQLLGVMGFAGKLAMIGAGLGVIVAVGGAVAMSFLKASDAGKTLEQRVGDLTEGLSDYEASVDMAVLSAADLAKKFGEGSEAARRFYAELAAIQGLSVAGKIEDLTVQVEKMLGLGRGGAGWKVTDFFGLGSGASQVAHYSEAIEGLAARVDALAAARGIEAQMAAMERLTAEVRGLIDLDGKRSAGEMALLGLLEDQAAAIGRLHEIEAKRDGLSAREAEILANRVELWRAAIDAGEAQARAAASQLESYQRQVDLQAAIAAHGAESAEVERVKRDQALATAEAFIRQQGLAGETAQAIRDGALAAYDAQLNAAHAADALRDAEAAAKALATAIAAAAGFSADLDNGVVVLQAKLNALQNQQNATNAATIAGLRLRAAETRNAALAAGELQVVAQARYATDMAVIDQQEELLARIEATTEANRAASSASRAGASASAKQAKELAKEAQAWRDLIDPTNKYRRQQAELDKLLRSGALTRGEVQQALAAINQEITEADPLLRHYASAVGGAVDYMLDGFRDGFGGLLDIARNTLKQIISMYLTNQITLSLGMGISGVAATGAGAAMAGGMGGNILAGAGLMGQVGGAFGGFLGGITGPLRAGISAAMQGGLSAGVKAWTASANASAAGVFGTASSLGTILGSAALGFGAGSLISGGYSIIGKNPAVANGIGTALGFALGGPVGAILGGALGGVVNRLFGRKLKDSGIQGSYAGGDFSGQSYEFYKGGLFRSDKTKRKPMEAEMAAMFDRTIDALRVQVGGMAAVLGAAPDALEDFSTSFKLSLKGLSAEEAQARIDAQFEKIGVQMVESIYAPVEAATTAAAAEGLTGVQAWIAALTGGSKGKKKLSAEFLALQEAGETALDTLSRLSSALSSANLWMDRLGKAAFAKSLAGGGKAWDFAEVFGGTEAMNEAVASYYSAFYSDGERLAQAKKELGAALNLLGINTLPASNTAFRALVDQAFASGDNTLAAKLIELAPAMAAITEETKALTEALTGLYRQDLFASSAEKIYAASSEGYRAASVNAGDTETRALLREVVKAIREGDINNARLTTRLLALQERASLEAGGASTGGAAA